MRTILYFGLILSVTAGLACSESTTASVEVGVGPGEMTGDMQDDLPGENNSLSRAARAPPKQPCLTSRIR